MNSTNNIANEVMALNRLRLERKLFISKKLSSSKLGLDNFNIKNDLLLSSFDLNSYKIMNWYSVTQNRICRTYLATLQLLQTQNDVFLDIGDLKRLKYYKNNVVIYVHNGMIFAPKCSPIDKITIDTTETECFIDIPITVDIDNKTKHMFLTRNNIIRLSSTIISCNNLIRFFPVSSKILGQRGNKINLETPSNIKKITLDELIGAEQILSNFNHLNKLTDDIDLLGELQKIDTGSDIGSNYIISNDHRDVPRENMQVWPAIKQMFSSFTRQFIYQIVFPFVLTILLTTCLFSIIIFIVKRFHSRMYTSVMDKVRTFKPKKASIPTVKFHENGENAVALIQSEALTRAYHENVQPEHPSLFDQSRAALNRILKEDNV